jgi:hypothetical protein
MTDEPPQRVSQLPGESDELRDVEPASKVGRPGFAAIVVAAIVAVVVVLVVIALTR